MITLNELRKRVCEMFPGRTVFASATCAFYSHYDDPEKGTQQEFQLTVFRPEKNHERAVAFQFSRHTPEEILAQAEENLKAEQLADREIRVEY